MQRPPKSGELTIISGGPITLTHWSLYPPIALDEIPCILLGIVVCGRMASVASIHSAFQARGRTEAIMELPLMFPTFCLLYCHTILSLSSVYMKLDLTQLLLALFRLIISKMAHVHMKCTPASSALLYAI